ncbi:hypothetical protein ACTFIU_004709 [Dictyostelium citrinum]
MTTQFNNKVGTLFNSLKRKLFEENEENHNNLQYTSSTNSTSPQTTNINTNILPPKKKRNKYYYNQLQQNQQNQQKLQNNDKSILFKQLIPDFNLHNIVSSVKSYLFNNSNNKTFGLFYPFISNNNNTNNTNNNNNNNNNNKNNNNNNNKNNNNNSSENNILDNKRTIPKRLPKSNILNRRRNSLTVPNHFHISLTMDENNNNNTDDINNNNNNKNNNDNNLNNMVVNSLSIDDNDNNVTQYDSDEQDSHNNASTIYLSDKQHNQSFVDYIQNQKENDDFNESVNGLINEYSSLSVESQIRSPQQPKITTTTTTTTTTTSSELISPNKSKFSDYQYFNNSSPTVIKKIIPTPPKSGVSTFNQQQEESIPFSLEELKSSNKDIPIFIESDDDEDDDNKNNNETTARFNGEESNYLNKSKSLLSSFRPKETPTFESLIDQIEQTDDSIFRNKMEKQIQKERDQEIGSLLQKLESLSSSSNKYNLFKTIEERMEMEKNKKPTLRQLTKQENQIIDDTFKNGRPDDIISELPIAEVKRSDIRLLLPGKWLNDEVINFYMEVLKIRDAEKKKSGGDFPKCHFFNTFFYPKLCNDNGTYNYEKVRRWTARVNLFEMDKIIIPIHLGNHWCLAVINFKAKQFEYYDSLLGSNKECLRKLRKYISDEMENKNKKGAVNLDEFQDSMPKEIPIQQNGYDCGVFMCKYAEFCSKGANLTFTQEEITQYRRRMVLEISNKQIID